MLPKLWIFILILIIAGFHAPVHAGGTQEIQSIAMISSHIHKKCDPKDCVVIGLGRSPTPFIAFLQTEIKNYAWNIPLSDFKYSVRYAPLSPHQEETLTAHFDRFFPRDRIKNRSVLLVDFGITGESLVAARIYLEKYLQKPIDTLLILSQQNWDGGEIHPSLKTILILKAANPVLKALENEAYDSKSQYGGYKITDEPKNKTQNGNYLTLLNQMNHLKKDSKVSDLLFKSFPINLPESLPEDFNNDLHSHTVEFCQSLPKDLLALDGKGAKTLLNQVKWLCRDKQELYYHLFFDHAEIQPTLCSELIYFQGSHKDLEGYLNRCVTSKSGSSHSGGIAALEEMASDPRFFELYEAGFERFFGVLPVSDQGTLVHSLAYYQGSRILPLLKQVLQTDEKGQFNQVLIPILNRYALFLSKNRNEQVLKRIIYSLYKSFDSSRLETLQSAFFDDFELHRIQVDTIEELEPLVKSLEKNQRSEIKALRSIRQKARTWIKCASARQTLPTQAP